MKNKAKAWLCIALALILIGACIAGLIQSNFGSVRIVDTVIETNTGTLTGYLLIPNSATASSPAPAIVTSHGYLNNKEMQDLNYVELARRGYVVFAMDAYSHGDSSVSLPNKGSEISRTTGGMYDAVEYLSRLDFVDSNRIGVTGHSMGGGYADATAAYYTTLEKDALAAGVSAEEAHALNKVAAALIVGNVPSYLDQVGTYLCNVGIIAGRWDEFFIVTIKDTVTTILDNPITKGLFAMQTGIEISGSIVEGQAYSNPETGFTMRLWSPWQTHPWNHFSGTTCGYVVEFFEDTLGAPNPLPSGNQIWQWKEFFNCVALVGFFLLLVPTADLLMNTQFFAELRTKDTLVPLPSVKFGRYILPNLISSIIAGVLIMPLIAIGFLFLVNPVWPQDTTGGIGLWSAGCGLVALLCMRASGFRFWKERREVGIAVGGRKIGKSILLSLVVTAIAFSTVFLTHWLFKTDFRIWTFAIRAFSPAKVWVAIRYLPFFLIFYLIHALGASRHRFNGWSEKKQIFMASLWNVLGILLFVALQYIPLAINGMTFFGMIMSGALASAGALFPLLMFPVVPILCIASAVAVKLYHKTGSIWTAGFINALVVTMLTVANTSFSYPY